ncbi:metallophosphoesterase [Curtobacterium ammoniigenes]|uniref:metallophosphoesterase n=1 Tax=Curtobacterium ammoniigenes TaxID=395387 RepID=UPI00082A6F6A|nr:metallophosphoesterase [Curtobacterium ammoniigenes]
MQPPASRALRIVHLSDTHLTGDGTLHQGTVDTTAALDAILDQLEQIPGVGLVVVSGDCSEDGSPASYTALRDRLVPWAAARKAGLVLVPGNHDQRVGFREVLGTGHLLGDGGGPIVHDLVHRDASVPIGAVSSVAGRRIVTLDTSVPAAGWGELSDEALDRLRSTLREPSELGSVLVLHHPPLVAPSRLHAALQLQNPDALVAALDGTDVVAVLAGHYHHAFTGQVATPSGARIPVLVAPGVANDTDITGSYEEERALVASGALIVDVDADGALWSTPVRTVRPSDGQEAVHHSAAQVQEIAGRFGR